MYQHDENTEARTQTRALTTLRLSTYSHYSDEPNKEMHTVLFALPHVTHFILLITKHACPHFAAQVS